MVHDFQRELGNFPAVWQRVTGEKQHSQSAKPVKTAQNKHPMQNRQSAKNKPPCCHCCRRQKMR